MSSAPTVPLVSVEEYLNTSYEHDMEFVDGVLVERGMPTPAHAFLQGIVIKHLWKHRVQFRYAVAPECRVELVKRSRYRIPDVLLCSLPAPKTKVLDTVPLAVIEIWSPDDRMPQQMARFREYWTRGVREIVVLDPEEYSAFTYKDGALIECAIEHIELPDGQKVPFSSIELLNELREELARQ
jgi:Uma2 family endonuclease